MTPTIYKYLDAALDLDIPEKDFWEMTLAELGRYFKSRKRMIEIQERKQASHNYILADLIGRSMARIYNSSNKFPTIDKVYPSLFTNEEVKKADAKRKQERFLAGLQQFARSHNNKVEEGGKNLNDK